MEITEIQIPTRKREGIIYMSKYYYVVSEFRDGDREYQSPDVLECKDENEDPKKAMIELCLSKMWENETIKDEDDEGTFWSPDREVCIYFNGAREITKKQFDVLKDFLCVVTSESKKEKVTFT